MGRPLCLHRLDNVHGEHLIYLQLLNLSGLWPCAVWGPANWAIIWFPKFDSLRSWFRRSEVSVHYALELCWNVNEFVTIWRIFSRYDKVFAPISLWNFVWLLQGVVPVHLLVSVLRQVMSKRVDTFWNKFVASRLYGAVICQHMGLVINLRDDARWGTWHLSDYYEPSTLAP